MLNRITDAPILPSRCCTQPILGRVHHSDWLNNGLSDKSVKLIIADPPYFEVKGDFDFVWKSFNDYLIDVEKWAIECKRLLANNGTLLWYGHAKKIAYSQIIFDKYFNLENNIAIEFNRQTKKGVEDFRCFAPVSERLLMYSNETIMTGLEAIKLDVNNFQTLRQYFKELQCFIGLGLKKINETLGHRKAEHGFYHSSTQWDLPIIETYNELIHHFQIDKWEGFKEYETLRQEYETLRQEYEPLRRPFNNFKKLFDIMSFDQEAHITRNYDHDTCKPETLTRALILTCSRPNDLVLVPFAGSGTEVAMAIKEGRQAIGFDVEEKYCQMSNDRINKILSAPELFA
jgi:site-specific DNA-methyltransferase (adenine-specific)